jgi:hypothetical protein
VRSASAVSAAVLVGLLAGSLAGCATTQQQSARLKVRAERLLASARPVFVAHAGPQVAVLATALLRGHGSSAAIVVRLRNRTRALVSDLPLTVGLRDPAGCVRALNRRAGLPYLQTHAPALAPGATAIWVFPFHARGALRGGPLARVGGVATLPARAAGDAARASAGTAGGGATRAADALPRVTATVTGPPRDGRVAVTVANDSGVPQYDLDVYALARRGRRLVAAGRASLAHLGTGARRTISIRLIGDLRGARVAVTAPPTLVA